MIDQYFGTKELYEVVLRAKTPMTFGSRKLEEGEPVLYFEKINAAMLTERSKPIMARGGWANMPRVIWEDRAEVQFTLSEGVMSSIGMGILLAARMAESRGGEILVPRREGPRSPSQITVDGKILTVLYLNDWPVEQNKKKIFVYEYERKIAQRKVYWEIINGQPDPFSSDKDRPCIAIYQDKALQQPADKDKQYIVDYYFAYQKEALIYTIQKERFNGLFTLEGKFYSKDENDGLNYTNIIYMPKVRVVSDISLRLGERADPTVSTFNVIGMPDIINNDRQGTILEITRLGEDIDGFE